LIVFHFAPFTVLAKLKGVYSMEVDMRDKTIRLRVANDAMGKQKIQTLVNSAIRSGSEAALRNAKGVA
jgi:hypothetical protein